MHNIPFYSLDSQHQPLREELRAAMDSVLADNWFVLGNRLSDFEKAYAAYSGCRHCAGVANGLDALVLALRAVGIGRGDEVIVPAHTFIATWMAVTLAGAKPVPVEPDPLTCNIDPSRVEGAITGRTKAIIPVHLYGRACDMTTLMHLAEVRKLFVIEDNAQAHGAEHAGKATGSFGHVNATSFYPTKNLGAMGDGGAVTTNDSALDQKVRQLRNYGSSAKYIHVSEGMNSRLDEVQAAILNVKLKHLREWTEQRQIVAARYTEQLEIGDLILPGGSGPDEHVFHLYVIQTSRRDALQQHLAKEGISTHVHYPMPPHLQEAYRGLGHSKGSFPITERIAASCLSLPLWPGMAIEDVDRVCNAIRGFY
jgi:dTDP-4-amino-4,6-dideoxygalactose transaminase